MTAEASPEVDFSTVTIVKASREQAIQSGINVIPLWCAPKGVTSSESLAWLDEQLHSPAHPWTAEQQSWVLVPRDDPTTTDILAHCDTYRRAGVVRLPDGRQRDVVTYNVGLVFTPPQRRKKGYAKHMMRLMHYVVAPLGVLPPFPQEWGRLPEERFGDATFSTLYSDVGDAFYARCTKGLTAPGWVASTDRAPHRVWNLDITDTDRQYPPDCVWLDDTGAIPLEKQMAAWMRSEAQSVGDAQRIRVFCSPEK
jgi:hypothetical protein